MPQNFNDTVLQACDIKKLKLARNPLAVFGKPIAHSQSPKMQNAALEFLSKGNVDFANWQYYKFEVAPDALCKVLPDFFAANFRGINLTIPHKQVIFDCAKTCAIEFDDFSKMAGACNTLIHLKSGWRGTNTDGFGLARAILNFSKRSFKGADVAILGAGGAARAAAFKAFLDGAKSVRICNRTSARLEELLAALGKFGFSGTPFFKESEILPNSIIINATSVGLRAIDAPVLDFSKVEKNCVFFDMPYISSDETKSVKSARAAGLAAASGLAMLAWQGALSLSYWTGADVEVLGNVMCKSLGVEIK